jgi:hypothetical protein
MPTKADTAIAGAAIDDLPQLWDGFAKLVRDGLDIRAFGVQIMDLPPDYTTGGHDESDTGQQELYVALRGAGAVQVAGERRLPLDAEHLVRVDASVERVLTSGPEGLRALCVGGVPGAAYAAPDWTSAG